MKRDGNKWIFEEEPRGDGQWMQSIDYTTLNCIVEEIELEKACDDCPITPPLGELGNDTTAGVAKHNHVIVVWRDNPRFHHQRCEVRKIESGQGILYEATTTEASRIKDKERQLDFFILPESKFPCNMPNNTFYPVQGMDSVFITYARLNKTKHPTGAREVIEKLREGISITAHTQFIRDLAVDRENALAREIKELDCSARRMSHQLVASTAQYDGWLAAQHLRLLTWQKISAVGGAIIIQRCQRVKILLEMETTSCGPQPRYQNLTLGMSGWELVPYQPCYWKGNLVNINGKPYTHREGDWQEVKPNLKIATHKLIHAYNHSVDNSLQYINTLNPAYRAPTMSHGDLMADLLSKNGQGSTCQLNCRRHNQRKKTKLRLWMDRPCFLHLLDHSRYICFPPRMLFLRLAYSTMPLSLPWHLPRL